MRTCSLESSAFRPVFEASIKTLVEDDVGRAFGHGIEAKRSKSGAITIREFVA